METNATNKTFVYAGSICVDSGQVMIGDPCYIRNDFDTEYDDPNAPALSYASACQTTLSTTGMGVLGVVGDDGYYGLAFASKTAYGDGVYDVFRVENDNGDFLGLYLEFLDGE